MLDTQDLREARRGKAEGYAKVTETSVPNMVSYIQEPHKLQAYPNLVLHLDYLLLHSDVLCLTPDTSIEHLAEHQLQPTLATDGPDAVFHLIVSFCHMRMQVEKLK